MRDAAWTRAENAVHLFRSVSAAVAEQDPITLNLLARIRETHYDIDRLWLAGALEPALADCLRAKPWQAWTWAARDVDQARLHRFSEGGLVFRGETLAEHVGRTAGAGPAATRPGGSSPT